MKADGTVAMEMDEVLKRWEEYIAELYEDDREEPDITVALEGPSILKSEIEKAMRKMKTGKAAGEDGIVDEALRNMVVWGTEQIMQITGFMHDAGEIPKQMRESLFVTIPKKTGTLECGKHRTIAISSQVSKISLRVVMERMRGRIRQEVGREQFGFMEGKGTANAIFVLRMLSERTIEMQKDLYACFIDYEKAFDRVKHGEMVKMLENIGVDGKDVRLVKNLYWNQRAAVKIKEECK